MSKKTIFLDLDGTLLNDKKEVSEQNQEWMNRALKAGNKIVISTGRPFPSAKKIIKKLQFDKPGFYCVCYNGGVIFECGTKHIIFQKALNKELAFEIIDLCKKNQIHCHTYSDQYVLSENDTEGFRYYLKAVGIEGKIVPDFKEEITWNPNKVLAVDLYHKETLLELKRQVNKAVGDQIEIVFSCDEYLEFLPKDVSKGNGVLYYCELTGTNQKDTIAVGDEENDLEMIQQAGIGCAMKNAKQIVRDHADYVTENNNNESGVAEIIEKFMF